MKDGKFVAIKRLIKGTSDERTAGFLSELGTIAHVNHPNTAKLIGCGIEGGMHLVFQLSPLGSLGSVLHGLFLICIVFLKSLLLPIYENFSMLLTLSRIKRYTRLE